MSDLTVLSETPLQKGQRIRMTRAAIKAEIARLPRREALLRVIEILEEPPEEMESMAIGDLLRQVRTIGTYAAEKVCGRAKVGFGHRIAGAYRGPAGTRTGGNPVMSARQRAELVRVLHSEAQR